MIRTLLIVALCAPLSGAFAQQPDARVQLPSRLAPATRAAIERLADSVRGVGLPSGPLIDKAAEGVLKGADDRRILAAVQSLAQELGEARTVLGSAENVPLLVAAASAVHAGVSLADLRRIVKPSSGEPDPHALGAALVTLADLVAKRVPAALAASSLADLVAKRVPESQYTALRSEVEQDIVAGRSPEASMAARARAHLRLADDPAAVRPLLPTRPPIG